MSVSTVVLFTGILIQPSPGEGLPHACCGSTRVEHGARWPMSAYRRFLLRSGTAAFGHHRLIKLHSLQA